MILIRRTSHIAAVKLLDSEQVTDAQWDAHVNELHTFFGDHPWTGDNAGIYIGEFPEEGEPLAGEPGQYVIKETWRNGHTEFYVLSEDEWLAKFEVA